MMQRARCAGGTLKGITPRSAPLTQMMNIMHLKTKVSDSIHSTQYLPPPHVHPPPRDDGSPPPWGGGTVHHSRPANSSITQLKNFFSAFGACDFLFISYCSWAK